MDNSQSITITAKILGHICLLRPLNLAIGAFSVLIGAAIAGELNQTAAVISAILVVVSFNAGANAINDYCDFEVDKINRPRRPLVAGVVNRNVAKWIGIVLFAGGVLLALQLNPGARLLALLAALPVMLFYSPVLKGQPLLGNLAVAFILGLTFLFAGAAVGNPGPLVVPALLAFGLTLVRELVKDIADIEGDARADLNTFPLLVGLEPAIVVAINLAFLVAAGTLLPFILGHYGIYYLLIATAGVIAPLFYLIYLFTKKPEAGTAVFGARMLKFATIAGVLAIYFG
ncbi:MAG: geranylgeranylglycerol-phosphate geranylgeranyltransferase [Candidatus Neomarinimicrobiota bacterium]